ncbi:helix-turn-helix domain-containing protein [Treponema sp.]
MVYELIKASRRLSELEISLDLDGCIVDVHWFRVMKKEGTWVISRHAHSSFEFHIIAQGECEVSTDAESFRIKTGNFYLTPPGVHHSQRSVGDDELVEYSLDCSIRCRRESRFAEMRSHFMHSPCIPFVDSEGIITLFEQALEEAYLQRAGQDIIIRSLVPVILVAAARAMGFGDEASEGEDESAANPRMERIIKFITDNLHQDLSTSDIAAFMNLGEKQVSRIVFASEGYSTKRLITQVKLEKAKELIQAGLLSMKEIAKELGFVNVSYFNNVFKKHEGITPGEFRSKQNK